MHLPFRALSLPLLLALPAAVRAVFQDEVGHIDYHHKLLGVPQRETTFFHRPRRDERASLLYTLTDLGVLGAVNPSNGDVVWRQQLLDVDTSNGDSSSSSTHLRAGEDEPWLASASGGSVQSWDAISGRNVWSLDFRGRVKDLEVMELTGNDHKDVLTLHAEEGPGASVARRIHGTEGRVLWEYREITGDVPLQVSTNVEKVFVVTLHGSLLSYGLKVIVLDTLTGKKLDEIPIGTKGEVQSERDVMFVGANSAAPIVAWTDNALTTLKVNVLGTKATKAFPLVNGATSVEIHSPHLVQSSPHFLVHTRTKTGHKGDVFHIDLKSNAITKAYELPWLEGEGAFSTSSINANVFFTRVTSDEVIITSSQSHGILSRWSLQQQKGKGADSNDKLQALHGVSEVIKKAEDLYAVRSAVVNDADDWVLIRNGEIEWTRPEGLSGVVAATWAEIPESEELAKTLQAEAHSNPLQAYIHRVNRHIDDLQYLPDWLQSIPGRLLSSVLGSDGGAKKSSDTPSLSRDSFGFNKLAVLATRRGKLYGIDVGNHGRIVWSKKASETPAADTPWDVRAIHADDVKGLVTVRGASGEVIIVKSDTGSTVESIPAALFPPIESAALVDSDAAGPWLLPIDVGGHVREVPAAWAPNPKQTVVTRTAEGGIQGLVFFVSGGEDAKAIATPAWTFLPPGGQRIATIASRPAHDPIASIGRVLGDRSVKYKYLNPNTIIVATINDDEENGAGTSLTVYLLDTVSGQVLHSAVHEGVDPGRDISCTIAENWFVCSFYGEYTLREPPSPSPQQQQQQQQQKSQSVKGYQLLVSDLYESELSNDRGPLGDGDKTASNFSSFAPLDNPTAAGVALPAVVSKAFVLPAGPLTALTSSQTRQGIASRLLLAYSPALRAVVGIPRAAIDPRRPAGRDPTPQELEEGLARYSPALDLDPRWVVSHERDVLLASGEGLGGKAKAKIITSPAVLESTSLVLAFGAAGPDVFGSRVAPSMAFDVLGNGFNKLALVATVGALGLGVLALGPLVRKKQINARWGGTT